MQKKILVFGLFFSAAFMVLLTKPSLAYSINKRQEKQSRRIEQGVKTGKISPQEAEELNKQQSSIATLEERDRKDGKNLNIRERARLQRKLNRTSVNIRKANSN